MHLDPAIAGKFSPQLSTDVVKLKKPIIWAKEGSVKLDGIRALTLDFRAVTRSFKNIPNRFVAAKLATVQGLDGEIIVGDANADDVFRVTDSAVTSHDGEPDFMFHVFDDLTRLDLNMADRQKVLQDRNLPSWITIVDQTSLNSLEEAEAFYERSIQAGYEGLMLRNASSMYKFGRCSATTQDSLKWKPYADDEAEILEVYEAEENLNEAFTNELGRTARSSHKANKVGKGMAGGFICRDLKTNVTFRVTAGKLKHAERVEVWNNKDNYPGKFVKYRHFTIGVKDKPRQGRWIAWFNPLTA